MSTQKSYADWKCPFRQGYTVDGYRTEMARLSASSEPRESAGEDCLTGDWVGAATCHPGRLRVVLADLESKGHAARPYHETLARHLANPVTLKHWLTGVDANWPGPRFASAGVVEVDTQRHEFRLLLAGHPDPLLWQPGNRARALLGCRLGLVGLNLGTAEAEPVPHPFPPGAAVVLVSDGVLDAGVATRDQAFGMPNVLRAIDAAPSAAEVIPHLLEALAQHVGGAEPEDDVTVVVLTRTVAAASMGASQDRLVA